MMNKICYRIKEYPYDNGMQLRASFSLEAFKISTSFLPYFLHGAEPFLRSYSVLS
jgi:hypothetical protein